MCRLFIGANPDLWITRSKSLRIDGVATSLRMEEFFWSILDEIAARDVMTVNQLITALHHEAVDAGHDMGNFTSFLRVCCARYLALIGAGEFRDDIGQSLRASPPEPILLRENARLAARLAALAQAPRRTAAN